MCEVCLNCALNRTPFQVFGGKLVNHSLSGILSSLIVFFNGFYESLVLGVQETYETFGNFKLMALLFKQIFRNKAKLFLPKTKNTLEGKPSKQKKI